jgi:hypothetical protein
VCDPSGLYGTIPNVKAKGQAAATVLQRFLNYKRQAHDPSEPVCKLSIHSSRLSGRTFNARTLTHVGTETAEQPLALFGSLIDVCTVHMCALHCVCAQPRRPEVDTLVLLDRATDLVTPLLTPLTYEGIIDEFLGIGNSCVRLEPQVVGDDG